MVVLLITAVVKYIVDTDEGVHCTSLIFYLSIKTKCNERQGLNAPTIQDAYYPRLPSFTDAGRAFMAEAETLAAEASANSMSGGSTYSLISAFMPNLQLQHPDAFPAGTILYARAPVCIFFMHVCLTAYVCVCVPHPHPCTILADGRLEAI